MSVSGHEKVVEWLITNPEYCSLWQEVDMGDLTMTGIHLDLRGVTPFLVACENGCEGVVRVFFQEGEGKMDFSATNTFGETGYRLSRDGARRAIEEMRPDLATQ